MGGGISALMASRAASRAAKERSRQIDISLLAAREKEAIEVKVLIMGKYQPMQ